MNVYARHKPQALQFQEDKADSPHWCDGIRERTWLGTSRQDLPPRSLSAQLSSELGQVLTELLAACMTCSCILLEVDWNAVSPSRCWCWCGACTESVFLSFECFYRTFLCCFLLLEQPRSLSSAKTQGNHASARPLLQSLAAPPLLHPLC